MKYFATAIAVAVFAWCVSLSTQKPLPDDIPIIGDVTGLVDTALLTATCTDCANGLFGYASEWVMSIPTKLMAAWSVFFPTA